MASHIRRASARVKVIVEWGKAALLYAINTYPTKTKEPVKTKLPEWDVSVETKADGHVLNRALVSRWERRR